MANPSLPNKELKHDSDGLYPEVEGLIVNDKVVLSSQQSNLADLAQTVNTGVVRDTTTVDSSAGGTAQTTNCTLIPAQSLLLNVEAEQTVAMDGDTTTTLEVGVSGNIDAYIDTSDFDPSDTNLAGSASGANNDEKGVQYLSSATQLIATWTNAASASTGTTVITVHYIPLANTDADDVDTKVNAILDVLESHGLMADT